MTDANSVSKGPTLAYAAFIAPRAPRHMVERNRRLWAEASGRVERQEFSEPAAGFLVFHEISFSFQCLLGHALTLICGPGGLLEDFAGNGRALAGERERQGPRKPVFQHSDAADGAFIAIVEVLEKIRFSAQWQVALEGEEDALKRSAIFVSISTVARKMNVNASPAQLRTQVAERQKLVRPDQHVNRVGKVGERLDGVKLVLKFATASHLREVLCLVDEERGGAAMDECTFEGVTYFETRCPRVQGESARVVPEDAADAVADLVINQRFFQRNQGAAVVVLPTKLGEVGSGFDTDHGNTSRVIFQSGKQGLLEVSFNPEAQGRLANASRPVDEDQGPSCGILDGLLECSVGLFQPGMGDGERAKIGHPRLDGLLQQGLREASFRHVSILLEDLGLKQHRRLTRHRLCEWGIKFIDDWAEVVLQLDGVSVPRLVYLFSLGVSEALQKKRLFGLDRSDKVGTVSAPSVACCGNDLASACEVLQQ